MSMCVNENCNKDPLNSSTKVVVSIDGDMACSPECAEEFNAQMNHFFSETLSKNQNFANYMGVNIGMINLEGTY